MSENVKKIAIAAVAVLMLVYIGHQAYSVFYDPYTTQTALQYTYYEKIDTNGYIVRDEELITSEYTGINSYVVGNGTRVAQDSVVANVFESEEDAEIQSRINAIDAEIAALEDLQDNVSVSSVDRNSMVMLLNGSFDNLFDLLERGDMSRLPDCRRELLDLLNKQQLVLGEAEDFSGRINELNSEKSLLASDLKYNPKPVTAPKAGYFIDYADAYEGKATVDDVLTLNADGLKELMNASPDSVADNVVGRLVDNYDWYIAVAVSNEDIMKLTGRTSVTVNLPGTSYYDITADIAAINNSGERDGDSVVVLECKYMSKELSEIRIQPIQIVTNDCTGIRVESRAVRFNDEGVMGVYVKKGSQVHFKPINVLYTGADFVICENVADSSGLNLYDDIIVEGKDLYDGKIVN